MMDIVEDKPGQGPEVAENIDSPIPDLERLAVWDFEPGAEVGPESGREPEPKTADMLLLIISPAFDLVAPNWRVTDKEKQLLAGAYGELIDAYFPNFDLGPIGGALAVTAMVVAPRLNTPRTLPEPEGDGAAVGGGDGGQS
jgi:hypothetical protein